MAPGRSGVGGGCGGSRRVRDADPSKELERHLAQGLAHRKCLVPVAATIAGYPSERG